MEKFTNLSLVVATYLADVTNGRDNVSLADVTATVADVHHATRSSYIGKQLMHDIMGAGIEPAAMGPLFVDLSEAVSATPSRVEASLDNETRSTIVDYIVSMIEDLDIVNAMDLDSVEVNLSDDLVLTHVSDVRKAMIAAAEKFRVGRRENVASYDVTLADLIERGIVEVGETLTFPRFEESARVTEAGDIEYRGTVYESASSVCKAMAEQACYEGKPSFNGWKELRTSSGNRLMKLRQMAMEAAEYEADVEVDVEA